MVRPWVVLQKTGAKVRRMKRPGLFAIIIANWIQWQQQLPLGEYSVQNSRIPPAGSEKFCLGNKSGKLRSFSIHEFEVFREHFYPFTTIPREILCILPPLPSQNENVGEMDHHTCRECSCCQQSLKHCTMSW